MKHPPLVLAVVIILALIATIAGFTLADRIQHDNNPSAQRVLPDADLLLPWPQRDMLERPGR